jgi:hypothetical protein
MPKGYRKDGTKLGFQEGHSSPLKGISLKPKISKKCPCGITFLLQPGRIRSKHGKYHTRKCFYKYGNRHMSLLPFINKKGEENHNFKGNKAGYKAMHLRVAQIRGKASIFVCEDCGINKAADWASINKKYEDVFDYKALCRKCHNKFDNIAKKAIETKRKLYGDDFAIKSNYKAWETRRGKTL